MEPDRRLLAVCQAGEQSGGRTWDVGGCSKRIRNAPHQNCVVFMRLNYENENELKFAIWNHAPAHGHCLRLQTLYGGHPDYILIHAGCTEEPMARADRIRRHRDLPHARNLREVISKLTFPSENVVLPIKSRNPCFWHRSGHRGEMFPGCLVPPASISEKESWGPVLLSEGGVGNPYEHPTTLIPNKRAYSR